MPASKMSLIVKQKQLFPALFAVWRPHLHRWQFCCTVRTTNDSVSGFKSIWRPWLSSTYVKDPSRTWQTITIGGRDIEYRRTGFFKVEELEDRGIVDRKILAYEFSCWRNLPRPTV